MLTDEQYGHQLGVQLRHELEDVHAAPNLVSRLRPQQARRTWAIRTAIAAPVVAAVAAAILVTTAGQGMPGEGRQANGTAQFENVAYVQEQSLKALSRASEYVIYAKTTWEDGHYDEWIDKATQRYRNDVYDRNSIHVGLPQNGKAQVPSAPTDQTPGPIHLNQSHLVTGPKGGDQEVVTVDYSLKRWYRFSDKGAPPFGPDITDPDAIRKAITDGTLELVGKEKVDGHDTLHLRLSGPKQSYRIDMWVDETNYLPVQGTAVKGAGGAPLTTKYAWLPRTEENLAHLTLTPPPGFEQEK